MNKINKFLTIIILSFTVLIVHTSIASAKSVSVWLPNWDIIDANNSFLENQDKIDVLSPFWYDVDAEGLIIPKKNSENQAIIDSAKENSIEVIPTITNSFDGEKIHPVLSDPVIRQQNIQNIVDLVLEFEYDGIDIDYEAIFPEDIDLFTIYIQELDTALNLQNKKLTIAVMSKSYPMMEKFSNRGQDWAALEPYVDEFRIMTYDYGWSGSTPRAIAPYFWVEEVIEYAIDHVPTEKIRLGIPFYAYSWSDNGVEGGKEFTSYTYETILEIVGKYQIDFQYSPADKTNRLFYVSNNDDRQPKAPFEIWFENHASLNAKLDLVEKYDLGGIAIWRLGGEDPENWQIIGEKLKGIPGEKKKYFNDVDDQTLYASSINQLAFLGLIKGQGDTGDFEPLSKINRAEILKIALNSFAQDTSSYAFLETRSADFTNPFPDVIDGQWYFGYVQTALENGIANGYPDGTFQPESNIIRVEALKLALESAEIDLSNYDDSTWYFPYRDWSIENGLYQATEFDPETEITRAEAAYIFDSVIQSF